MDTRVTAKMVGILFYVTVYNVNPNPTNTNSVLINPNPNVKR